MHDYNEARQLENENIYPKNVRQIGEVNYNTRIYIEDYVYTYLHQYASNNKKGEQIAFLVGEIKECINEQILIISGAIQAKFLNEENGALQITDDTVTYIHEKRKQYFDNLDTIGWVCTQPGYGVLLTSHLLNQHKEYFEEEGQVLYILDPIEKEELFFQTENGSIVERAGFFIYYEKNSAMHEYMLDYKVQEFSEKKEDDVVKHYRVKDAEKKEELYHKKFVHMLTALSAALILMCIVIGVGLINNIEEMNKLKKSVDNVMSEYTFSQDDSTVGNSVQGTTNELQQNSPPEEVRADNNVEDKETNEGVSKPTNQASLSTSNEASTLETSKLIIPETYTIRAGDNLIKISYRFYKSKDMVSEIQILNNIENPDLVYIGQTIHLPEAK